MPYRWEDFLVLAQRLSREAPTTPPEEAAYRSAVSRAYYAAFNHACVYAEINHSFHRTHTAEDHLRVRMVFQREGDAATSDMLEDLRRWRNTCDYDDSKAARLIANLVTPALTQAETLIRKLT